MHDICYNTRAANNATDYYWNIKLIYKIYVKIYFKKSRELFYIRLRQVIIFLENFSDLLQTHIRY